MKYIDTHSHPHLSQYDADREAVFARMREAEVGTIAVGTTFETSRGALDCAVKHAETWAAIGIHPNDTKDMFDDRAFESLIHERVVAIGECGIDYFRTDKDTDGVRQRENFERHIAFAVAHDLPLMLHVRASKGSTDAHDEALALIDAAQRTHGERVRGNAHFFTAPLAVGKQYWSRGFTTAFPGVVTFAPELREVVQAAPLDMILSETDSPYAAPVPYRGRRNEPAFVVEIVNTIAAIRAEGEEAVRTALIQNARRLFRLPLA